jgi:hypothetical protein
MKLKLAGKAQGKTCNDMNLAPRERFGSNGARGFPHSHKRDTLMTQLVARHTAPWPESLPASLNEQRGKQDVTSLAPAWGSPVTQLLKNFGTRKFVTALTTALHSSLSITLHLHINIALPALGSFLLALQPKPNVPPSTPHSALNLNLLDVTFSLETKTAEAAFGIS